MTASITTEVDLTGGPSPRIGVSLAGWSADGSVDVYRVHPDTSRHLVRGMSAVSGGAAFGWDYEAPLGVPLHYEADDAGATVRSFGPVERTNLIDNPSFEIDTGSWNSGGGRMTLSRVDAAGGVAPIVGSWSIKAVANVAISTSSGYLYQASNVVPGNTYTGSAYVTAGKAGNYLLRVEYRDAANAVIASYNGDTVTLALGEQRRLSSTAPAAPANAVFGYVYLFYVSTMAIGEWFAADAVLLETGTELLPYFDADHAVDALHTSRWTGTVGDSPSESRLLDATLDDDQVWVTVPGLPAYAVPVELVAKPAPARTREQTALHPMGRTRPIVLSDVLGSPEFKVTLRTKTLNDAESLEQVVAAAGTLLVRIPGIRRSWQYLAVDGAPELPVVPYRAPAGAPPNHIGNWSDWVIGGPEVDSPVGGLFGDPTASYQVLLDTYADYSAVLADEADYVDVLKGVVS